MNLGLHEKQTEDEEVVDWSPDPPSYHIRAAYGAHERLFTGTLEPDPNFDWDIAEPVVHRLRRKTTVEVIDKFVFDNFGGQITKAGDVDGLTEFPLREEWSCS